MINLTLKEEFKKIFITQRNHARIITINLKHVVALKDINPSLLLVVAKSGTNHGNQLIHHLPCCNSGILSQPTTEEDNSQLFMGMPSIT